MTELMKQNQENKGIEYSKKFGEKLYHYTNGEALFGLLKNKEVWLGSTESMNDKKEAVLFVDRLEEELKSIDEIDLKKCNNLFHKIRESLEGNYPFAFCLSKSKDDAAQWERYSNNATGFCVAFNTSKFISAFLYANGTINEMFYSFDVKEHNHFELLKEYLLHDTLYEFETIEGLISNLIVCGYFHKHYSFSAENEVRLSSLWNMPISFSKIEVKNINGTIRKFLIVNLEALCKKYEVDFEDLIDEIVIGPRSKQNIEELKEAIKMLGYSKLPNKVKYSECPLR